jgi:hypothetical protein
MKKFLLLAGLLMSVLYSNSQALKPVAQRISDHHSQHAEFSHADLFEVAKIQRAALPAITQSNATVLNINKTNINALIKSDPKNLLFSIPLKNGRKLDLELYRAEIFTPDFSVVTSDNNKPANVSPGVHYQGIIAGDNSSLVAISIFDGELMGLISTPAEGNLVLGKISNDQSGRHILYNDNAIGIPPQSSCYTTEGNGFYLNKDLQTPTTSAANCIRLYWEVNYDIYQNKGGLTNTTNYMTGLFNQSAIIYTNDGIPVTLSQLYIWSSTSPYTATSTSNLLSQFQSYRNSFNGDLGHLIGYAGGGGVAASIGGMCNSNLDYTQCYSGISSSYQNVPTYSWSVMVVTHEQGHLMGSRHTHACVWNGNGTAIDGCGPSAGYNEGTCSAAPIPSGGGTIMSYCHLTSAGINFTNGFGTQPRNVILNKFNTVTCLSACTGTACNAPTAMNTSSITTSSALISWTGASGASSYNIQYRITGTSVWSSASTTSTSFALSGLNAATSYEWQVQTICSSGNSSFTASSTFTTSAPPTCNAPSGMNTLSVTTTSAVLTWVASSGAISYNLQYRVTGTSVWSSASTTSASFTLNNLTPTTSYEWQVQTVCSFGNSPFSQSVSFVTSTPATCNAPTGMSTSSVTESSALLSWVAASGAASYNVQYRVTGTSLWSSASTTSTSVALNNLISSTPYEWQVQTVCSSGNSSFTSSSTFTTATPATCGIPSGLSGTATGASTASLGWSVVNGASYYNIQWKETSASLWNQQSSTINSLPLSGLNACSAYQFQVQAICAGATSSYSGAVSFTTTGCPLNYCTSSGNSSAYGYINRIALGAINNTTGFNGYADFTSQSTNITGGGTYTMTFVPGPAGNSRKLCWSVYIDYNQNGSFSDAGELVISAPSKRSFSRSFTVPVSAANGPTRMRVQMQYNVPTSGPCAIITNGEVEDYSVNISGNAQLSMMTSVTQPAVARELRLYPNPASSNLTFDFNGLAGYGKVNIYSMTGQLVFEKTVEVIDGENKVSIDLSLPNGIYFFSLINNGIEKKEKLTIQN